MRLKVKDQICLKIGFQFGMVAFAAFFVFSGGVKADSDGALYERLYYTVKPAQVSFIEEQGEFSLDGHATEVTPPAASATPAAPNETLVVIDQIINLGKKIWEVVSANQPVVNIQTDSANAVPQGVTGWEALEGWQAPMARTYHVQYENLLGMTVVEASFRVLFTPGGNYHGKGLYLTHVVVIPSSLTVAWGYKFGLVASVPSITNAGTSANPIAAAEVLLNWKVDTAVKHDERTISFYVRGDGVFSSYNLQ
ncbi:hypothetical protein WDW37_15600 [Bdellovibrionota bacterium FG-1]